jgi:hypothetical protein
MHTQPIAAALMAGAFLLRTGEGNVYSEEDVRQWLKAVAGLGTHTVGRACESNHC